jgi:hypothetical protein
MRVVSTRGYSSAARVVWGCAAWVWGFRIFAVFIGFILAVSAKLWGMFVKSVDNFAVFMEISVIHRFRLYPRNFVP